MRWKEKVEAQIKWKEKNGAVSKVRGSKGKGQQREANREDKKEGLGGY